MPASRGEALRRAVGLIAAVDDRHGPEQRYTEEQYAEVETVLFGDGLVEWDQLCFALVTIAMIALEAAAHERIEAGRANLLSARELLADLATKLVELEDE